MWVGAPTGIAAYLLYFFVRGLSAQLDHISSSMDRHVQDMSVLVQHLQNDNDQAWVSLGVMQRICLNTAKTGDDRIACVSIARKASP